MPTLNMRRPGSGANNGTESEQRPTLLQMPSNLSQPDGSDSMATDQMPDPRLVGKAQAAAGSREVNRVGFPSNYDAAINPDLDGNDMENMMLTYGMVPDKDNDDWNTSDLRALRLSRSGTGPKGCRGFCQRLSSSLQFQAVIGILIVLNAVTMGFEVDSDESTSEIYHMIESVFTVIFLIEVMIRFIGCPPDRPFYKDFQLLFDSFLVFITMLDNWVLYYMNGDGGDAGFDFSLLMLLRLLRLARILRIFRAVAMFRPMRVLIATIANAAQTLIWTVILLLAVFYCFGLTFRMLFESTTKSEVTDKIIDKYFASLWDCLLTQFEILLGGFDWYEEITAPLIHSEDHLLLSIVWILFLCVMNLCVANVITGVFVEQLLMNAKESDDALSRELFVSKSANLNELKQVFKDIDGNQRGFITAEEFSQGVQSHPRLAELLGIEPEEADIFFNALDLQSRGAVKVDDFIFGIIKLKGGTKSVDMLSFDYQIKQIIRLVQKSPQRIDELLTQMKKFESALEGLWTKMEASHQAVNSELPAMGERMSKLEVQIDSFLAGLAVEDKVLQTTGGATGGATGAPLPNSAVVGAGPISLTNLRESYALADEMREIRRVMALATRAANGERLNPSALPVMYDPSPISREESDTDRAMVMAAIPSMTRGMLGRETPRGRMETLADDGTPEVRAANRSASPGVATERRVSPPPSSGAASRTGVPAPNRLPPPEARSGHGPSTAPVPPPAGPSLAMQRLEEAMGGLLPLTSLRNNGR